MLPTRPLDPDSGSQCTQRFALKKAVAVKVSGGNHFEFILKATGVVTSPNHPDNYPRNLDKTQTIEVESGKILRLEFTHFAVRTCGDITDCSCDFVKITDGDGTTLMDNSCGHSSRDPSDSDNSCGYSDEDPSHEKYFQPPIIMTRSNRMEVFFHTDGSKTHTGWSLSWSAVTPGEKALMLNSSRFFHPFDLNLNFDIFIAT